MGQTKKSAFYIVIELDNSQTYGLSFSSVIPKTERQMLCICNILSVYHVTLTLCDLDLGSRSPVLAYFYTIYLNSTYCQRFVALVAIVFEMFANLLVPEAWPRIWPFNSTFEVKSLHLYGRAWSQLHFGKKIVIVTLILFEISA